MTAELPAPNTSAWCDLPRAYVERVASALPAAGVEVQTYWLDPCDPRDATIVLMGKGTQPSALVWDEESGWRLGPYVSGEPGVRTVLAGARYQGTAVLPHPDTVAQFAADMLAGLKAGFDQRPAFRSYEDTFSPGDGFDAQLAAHARVLIT